MQMKKQSVVLAVMTGAFMAIAGCGGGGGSAPATLAIQQTTVSGTAATGSPITGATVVLKDAFGASATGSTASDGSYHITTSGMAPPFLVQVATSTGAHLYSVSSTGQATDVINVTPWTDLIVRSWYNLSGKTTDAAFAAPVSNPAPPPTVVASLSSAVQTMVAPLLTANGVSAGTAQAFNPIASPFLANGSGIDLTIAQTTATPATAASPAMIATSSSVISLPLTLSQTGAVTAGTISTSSPGANGGTPGGGGSAPTSLTKTVFAGSSSSGSTDGTGTAARFFGPEGLATDGTNLYVTDSGNYTIRKVSIATGEVTTLAGTPGLYGTVDGTGPAARFFSIDGIATDGTRVYVADSFEQTIRSIAIQTGQVSTIAGSAGSAGTTDGVGLAARFNDPGGMATDGTYLYVPEGNSDTIRRIKLATGEVTTIAGNPGQYGWADGTGSSATFYLPEWVVSDGTNLYVADTDNNTIRKILLASGAVTTLAGGPGQMADMKDGVGTAARFYHPSAIATDGANLYVSDTANNAIRKVVLATGAVSTIASVPAPLGIAVVGSAIYVCTGNTIVSLQ